MMKNIYTESICLFKDMCIQSNRKASKREIVCPESLPKECKQCRKRATYKSNLEVEGISKVFSLFLLFRYGMKELWWTKQGLKIHRKKSPWNSELSRTYSEFSPSSTHSIWSALAEGLAQGGSCCLWWGTLRWFFNQILL